MSFAQGCTSSSSGGSAIGYRQWASDDVISLPTGFWRQHAFFSLGKTPAHLFDLELPDTYTTTCTQRDWCGRSYSYQWDDDAIDLEIRTSMPGPLFTLGGKHLRLRCFTGSEWRDFEDLQSGQMIDCHGSDRIDGGRLYYVHSDTVPVLIISSQPLFSLHIISHRHYDFECAHPGARILVVPLLCVGDVPRDPELQKEWLRLVENPPLHIEESFKLKESTIEIIGSSDGDSIALSPMLSLLGEKDNLLSRISGGTQLLHTWCGPYILMKNNIYSFEVAAEWLFAELQSGSPAAGDLSEIPEEMAYAGDATWEPDTVMDQLFSIRSWAPYVHNAPAHTREEILARLPLPTVSAFQEAVEIIDGESAHGRWGRWRSMWAHNGDACYDIDWYNGLALSGLARAVQAPIEDWAREAQALSVACKKERSALFNYFVVYMDWMHHCAMTDPHGWMWNADCIHNGLEGVIAEAQLRKDEGDDAGAAFAYYIAARTAVGLRAAMELYQWHQNLERQQANHSYGYRRMVTWSPTAGVNDRVQAAVCGVQEFCGFKSFTWCTGATRNPYVLAGHNPAWSLLLRNHWSEKESLCCDWDAHEPLRYTDWISYYIGDDWQQRRDNGDQEARVQASVFYHLAPEISYRFWTLGQSAHDIEARFATPLPMNEQIMLRSGCQLVEGAIDWPQTDRDYLDNE